jgi:CheY-like chemotaxis protein
VLHIAASAPSRGAPRRVRFRVEDTGAGIAPEHLARIFEPFEQVGSVAARAEGTGLGLSITQRLVELMGGSIRVESQLGQGSLFEVELPLMEVNEALGAEQKSSSWERITGYEGARRTLLVVDDRPENHAVLRHLLAPLGFHVLEAASGEEALELSLSHRPDAVLMDLNMPGMDGYEATRRLRRMPELAEMLVFACSASVSTSVRERSAGVGCNDFLPKPFELGALLELLEGRLGLVWRFEAPAPPASNADVSAPEAVRPPADMVAALLELADKGRVRGLIKEIDRLHQADASLGPFLRRLREVAMTFQTEAVRAFLRGYLAPDVP